MARTRTAADIAARIADGSQVDWASNESTSVPTGDPEVLANLKSIAALAMLHRAPADETVSGPLSGNWGPLTIIEPLAQGRFGQVYRAWDARLARQVALKILHADASPAAALPTRAIDEARLLARVRHPNVLTVYGAECIDGRTGIWSELIEGRTLHQLLEERGPFPADDVAAIGHDLASALAAVHEAGLLHRDVKTQNVMREPGGRVVLMDFGTSHDAGGGRRPRDLSGTPLYMAPEMFTGAPSPASDQYALAVLLFRLLTGQFPVSGRTLEEVQAGHEDGRSIRLRDLRSDLPEWLTGAIDRGLAAQAAARFATAQDFARALDIQRRRREAEQSKARQRNRRFAAATLLGAVAIVAVGIVWSGSNPPVSILSARQLTSSDDASRGVITNDGTAVIYVRRGATQDIWLQGIPEKGNPARLLRAGDQKDIILGLTPTPDAGAVDVLLRRGSTRDRINSEIWRYPVAAGTPVQIAPAANTPPGWSPDGKHIAYVMSRGYVKGVRHTSLVIASGDGTAESSVDMPSNYFVGVQWAGRPTNRPAWSPDGRTIALAGIDLDGEHDRGFVLLVDVATKSHDEIGVIEQRSLEQPEVNEVAWLDEHRLLVSRDSPNEREGAYSLWELDIRTRQYRPVTSDLASYEGVSLSGSGRDAVATRINNGPGALWSGASDGALRRVTPESVHRLATFGVSRQGHVYFTAATSVGRMIRVLDPDGAEPRDVFPALQGRLTPSGEEIVFVASSNPRGLYKMRVDGTNRTPVAEGVFGAPLISPDGKYALVMWRKGRVQGLWSVELSSGFRRQVVPEKVSTKTFGPDGRLYVEVQDRERDRYYSCTLPNCADLREEVALPNSDTAQFTPDCQSVRRSDPAVDLVRNFLVQRPGSALVRRLTNFDDGQIGSSSFSTDCRHFAVVRSAPNTSDIVLLNLLKVAR